MGLTTVPTQSLLLDLWPYSFLTAPVNELLRQELYLRTRQVFHIGFIAYSKTVACHSRKTKDVGILAFEKQMVCPVD